jgi:hypothetical protein
MNLNTNGLMSGFLNGWQTMASYQHQQHEEARENKADQLAAKADQRQDRLTDSQLSLADAQKQHQNWLERNTEQQQKERNGQWDQDFSLRSRATDASIASQQAQTGLAQQRLDIEQQNANLQQKLTRAQLDANEKRRFVEDNFPVLQAGYNNLLQGQPVSKEQYSVMTDQRAGALNLNKYLDSPDYANAADRLSQSFGQIESGFKPGDFHSQSFYDTINSPQNIQDANVVFRDELDQGVGQKDGTGKKIVKKELSGFTPLQNGGIALNVTPIYEDGSKGQSVPVTEGRSSDPNDQVQAFSPSDIVGVVRTRAGLAGQIANSVNALGGVTGFRQKLGFEPAPDPKGFAQVATRIDADASKQIQQLMRNSANSMVDSKELDAQIQDIRNAAEQQKNSLKSYYGFSEQASADKTPSQVTPRNNDGKHVNVSLPVAQWAASDPMKAAYLQGVVQAGKFDPVNGNPVQLEMNYRNFQNTQKAESLEGKALNQQ